MNKESKILLVTEGKKDIEYYMFYKTLDKSNKSVKAIINPDEPEADLILKKNLKMMLQEIDNLASIERAVQAKNNILDIKRCILQTVEKNRINQGS